MKKFTFILLLLFIIFTSLFPESNKIRFKNISAENNLAPASILCIYQDKLGFLWFGTDGEGLYKFDGYTFKQYVYSKENNNSLSYNVVWSIVEDQLGNLWIGTEIGLNKFILRTEKFIHFFSNPNDPYSLTNNFIRSVIIDKQGMIWIGTQERLNKFDPKLGKFFNFKIRSEKNNYLINMIYDLYEDDEGNIWIGSDGGWLTKYNQKKNKFTSFNLGFTNQKNFKYNRIWKIQKDKLGNFWIGTDLGLFKFKIKRGSDSSFEDIKELTGFLNSDKIYSLFEDKSSTIWIGTKNGLVRIIQKNNRFIRYKSNSNDPDSLSNDDIRSIFEDESGVLWIGTRGGGINQIVKSDKLFEICKNNPTDTNSLTHNSVWSIYEDKSGSVWIGTIGGGLNKWDRRKDRFKHYINNKNNPNSLLNDKVLSILESHKTPGIFWIGTEEGLDRFELRNERFTHFRINPIKLENIRANSVYSLCEDKDGILWIGTDGGGLKKFNQKKNKFTHYYYNSKDPYCISNNRIWIIQEDSKGNIWIGTDCGLNKLVKKDDRFIKYRTDKNNPYSLNNDFVISLYEDTQGILWIGTVGGGLNKFDGKNGLFYHFNKIDGLPGNIVYGILEDKKGNLWLSTNRGLSRFDPQKKVFRNYIIDDGLQDNDFNIGAYFKNAEGIMFFGGNKGLNIFDPEKIKSSTYSPPIIFTDLKIFNKSVHVENEKDSLLTQSISFTKEVILSYKIKFFSFEFASLDYNNTKRNLYSYQLEGFLDEWIFLGNRREVFFTNLNPGKYLLKVRGTNSDGIWNNKDASIRLIITPSFFQTLWFKFLIFLIVLLILYRLYKTRTTRIINKITTEQRMLHFFKKWNITCREQEILKLLLKGISNKEIEDKLYISEHTVRNHIYNIYKKLKISSRIQLIKLFQETYLINSSKKNKNNLS